MNPSIDGKESPETGVYYRAADYAGFWRRLVVDLLDIVVIAVLWVVVAVAVSSILPYDEQLDAELPGWARHLLVSSWLVAVFGYLVLLKRSRFRTLGYRLCGTRCVDLQGQPPGIHVMTIRLLFAVLGVFNFLVDLIWIPQDPCHQSLRDKIAHTYVVRYAAEPEGRGGLAHTMYYVMASTFHVTEVRKPESGAPS